MFIMCGLFFDDIERRRKYSVAFGCTYLFSKRNKSGHLIMFINNGVECNLQTPVRLRTCFQEFRRTVRYFWQIVSMCKDYTAIRLVIPRTV